MKSSPPLLLLLAPVIGLAAGWRIKFQQARNASTDAPAPEASARASSPRSPVNSPPGGRTGSSDLRSSDTAADLHALPTGDLYDRMALFLLEAEAGDFPAFYEEFKNRSDRTNDLNDLLFIHWTRLDPEAAVAASRGTSDFKYAYWAWACHDPATALATAIAQGEGVGHAAWGIGEFHPAWLEENWDLIPENQRHNAIQGLVKWPDTETPEATLRLLHASKMAHYGINPKTLLALARQDPTNAYAVIKELSANQRDYDARQMMDTMISTLSRHDPRLLGEIAASTKSPIDKNKFQLAQFKGLLRNDPAAAKAMIETTSKSWLSEDLTINYAKHLLRNDPEEGFEYAIKYLKNDFKNSNRSIDIAYENGRSGRGVSSNESQSLINNLIHQDAPALLNELIPDSTSTRPGSAFQNASSTWAHQNVGAYAEWLEEHRANPAVYRSGVTHIVDSLQRQGQFEAGMEWAQTIETPEGKTNYHMKNLYRNWQRQDPEGATAWRLSDQFTGDPQKFPLPQTNEQE